MQTFLYFRFCQVFFQVIFEYLFKFKCLVNFLSFFCICSFIVFVMVDIFLYSKTGHKLDKKTYSGCTVIPENKFFVIIKYETI